METAAVHHYPPVNKGYFDQKCVILIPSVTQLVQKAFTITNKTQTFQLVDDWQNCV